MEEQPAVLYAACERVPGCSAPGTRLGQLLARLSPMLQGQGLRADGLCLKDSGVGHIQRLGVARMMRVPVPEEALVAQVSAFQRALRRQLQGDNYELCHTTDAWAAAVAAAHKDQTPTLGLIAELSGLPSQALAATGVVLDVQVRRVMERGEALVLERADALLVEGRAARDAVVAAGCALEKVHIMGPVVDDQLFFSPSVELRLDSAGFVVTYAGAPVPGPGLTAFLGAVAQLPPSTQGILCQWGENSEAARAALLHAGLQNRVVLEDTSTQEKLARVYQRSDAVVLWSTVVGPQAPLDAAHLPRRLAEAMACKRAVVTQDTVGARELLRGGRGGGLIPPGDVAALGAFLVKLQGDSALRSRLAAHGHEAVREDLWSTRLGAYKDLYAQVRSSKGTGKHHLAPRGLLIPVAPPQEQIKAVALSPGNPSTDPTVPLVTGQLLEETTIPTHAPPGEESYSGPAPTWVPATPQPLSTAAVAQTVAVSARPHCAPAVPAPPAQMSPAPSSLDATWVDEMAKQSLSHTPAPPGKPMLGTPAMRSLALLDTVGLDVGGANPDLGAALAVPGAPGVGVDGARRPFPTPVPAGPPVLDEPTNP